MNYHVIAISDDIANQTRTTLKSPQYGHPAHVEVAAGYGPCRSCLQRFQEGEEDRILFTYEPFAGLGAIPAPGPVFIHAKECVRYEAPGFPPGLLGLPLVFEGIGRDGWLITRERVLDGLVDDAVDRLFAQPVVDYIHVRNAEVGCFIARIERNETEAENPSTRRKRSC